jgi:hypothetical protein
VSVRFVVAVVVVGGGRWCPSAPFDSADGGRAPAARMGPRVEVGASRLENVDWAELGRSGRFLPRAARRWAMIASRTDGRVCTPGLALTLLMLETEDAMEPLLGLLMSFSSANLILGSSRLAMNLGI